MSGESEKTKMTFRANKALLVSIQAQTRQGASDVCAFFYSLAQSVFRDSSDKFKSSGTKSSVFLYPNTDVHVKVRFDCHYYDGCHYLTSTISCPSDIFKFTDAWLKNELTECQLLGKKSGYFIGPKIKGTKRLKKLLK